MPSVIIKKITRRFIVVKNQRIYTCTSPFLYECRSRKIKEKKEGHLDEHCHLE